MGLKRMLLTRHWVKMNFTHWRSQSSSRSPTQNYEVLARVLHLVDLSGLYRRRLCSLSNPNSHFPAQPLTTSRWLILKKLKPPITGNAFDAIAFVSSRLSSSYDMILQENEGERVLHG